MMICTCFFIELRVVHVIILVKYTELKKYTVEKVVFWYLNCLITSIMKNFFFLIAISIFLMSLSTSDFVNDWISSELFKPASVSLTVYDLEKEEYLIEENSEKVLAAASTQKLITTAIALHSLPSDYRFETKLAYTGSFRDGVLRGDIYIFPNFNPSLGNKRFNRDLSEITGSISKWLVKNKIKVIQGIKVVDPTIDLETLPRTWIWEDIGNYYGANPCGTVFNENVLEIYFESGQPGEQTKIVKMIPDLPLLKIENRVKASDVNKDLAYCFGGPYESGLVVEGTIPANRRKFKVRASLQRPQKALSFLVYNTLKQGGLTIKGKYGAYSSPKKNSKQFASIKSPLVQEIVKKTNHKSVNILAENLLQNSYHFSKSEKDMNAWVKWYLETQMEVGVAGMQIKDGSGLSKFNAISSKQIVQVLIKMRDNQAFKYSIPLAGKSGTVRSFLKNSTLNGYVRCKSGSMTGVRSYAGYINNKSGGTFAFSVIVNNADGLGTDVQAKIEELIDFIGLL
ncbi:MAG: D-alanyl-D-alanine carboxypeptidase/D-alanyl-D-alanine-endopeptidase [Flavobacteriales bacterium]|nr:D-alanyl-D-alanine carboxypeptidase/D-alanyl-D-alanine-endopeptidase [Flavobacteriales bacterium]